MIDWRSVRGFVAAACTAAACLAAIVAPADATVQEPTIPEMVRAIFGGEFPDEGQAVRILRDESTNTYYAFYVASYLGTPELRAYKIPFASSRDVQAQLESGDMAGAFEELIGWMRLDMGARYVSDVALDGINEREVQVGQGHMRDRFHSQLFGSHAEADEAYREWLRHAHRLVGS